MPALAVSHAGTLLDPTQGAVGALSDASDAFHHEVSALNAALIRASEAESPDHCGDHAADNNDDHAGDQQRRDPIDPIMTAAAT